MRRAKASPDTPISIQVVVDNDAREPFVVAVEHAEPSWLPFIGPTAMVLARRLVADSRDPSINTTIYVFAYLARDLGVGVPRLWAAFTRLRRVKLLTIDDTDSTPLITVRSFWPRAKVKA